MIEVETASPGETEWIAGALAAGLEAGDCVHVTGELGAGKTTFIRGACRALGVTGAVTSPTFTIGHRYAGRVPVSHLDLYRFDGMSDAEWGDLEPYFGAAVLFIEWPDAAAEFLPDPRLVVTLKPLAAADRRLIALATPDGSIALEAILEAALDARARV